ncbi:hypothetical protein [Flavobacterium psychrotolerans]|uniref:Uncharacterized protein n=1 Tax=Flavobacterium psychrotolerans TaxID=2169410 RepID=A0A2U1JKX8_9FLAO|nr:hypothetical protein [Flavobacterium psychrotolerans]PWA05810.1 hypothetical protein DB895_05130 [Flavobacterium psychrotolerans]
MGHLQEDGSHFLPHPSWFFSFELEFFSQQPLCALADVISLAQHFELHAKATFGAIKNPKTTINKM